MSAQLPAKESMSPQGLNLFSAKSVKFWGLGGAALASLMLFPEGTAGEIFTGLSVVGMGAFLFWNRLKPNALPVLKTPETLSKEDLIKRFNEIKAFCQKIEAEAERLNLAQERTATIRASLAQLENSCDRTQINLFITGKRNVGKTTLLSELTTASLEDVTITEQAWDEADIPSNMKTADLILFVADGDLTQTELNQIKSLQAQHKPSLVLLNKIDQLRSSEQERLSDKFHQVLTDVIEPDDYLAIATNPQEITVRRHQTDGSIQETTEQPAPQLQALSQRLDQRLAESDRQQLVWQQVYGEALQLRQTAVQSLNALRRQRAIPLIEKYQWLSASAAFASPLPSTDMIAAAAITGKLVTDLGEIYEHQFSLSEAQNIAAILAQALLKLGLVELSSQLLGVALKSHAATYVAGGFIQGLSVAYLTHIAGLSLIEHFEAMAMGDVQNSQLSLKSIQHIVERVFAQNQRVDFLKGLVGQGLNRLQPAS